MSREIGLIEYGDIDSFHPSDKQTSLKILLHDRVAPNVLGKLVPSQIDVLENWIAPFTLAEVKAWMGKPGFFSWLLLPDSFQITIQKAKASAAEAVVDMLNVDVCDETINPKLLSIKLKAAELLLKTEMKREQRISNTIKVTQNLPKHLVSKSNEALEAELKRIRSQE